MGINMTKDQGITVSVSTLASIAATLGSIWLFAAPIAETALAGEIEKQLEQKIKPIQDANIITITATVRNLQNAIIALEFKRDMCGASPDCWTVRDAGDLQAARNDLSAAQAALTALKQ
jgi:hypothetical protein